ncbi:LEA domain protein [Aspergillus avenaceus]|uniref:LEA domain protein n=1 Tax=Aspergillus avenaceus TaxID=36643 RepID=A0A5N6TYL0_ASPAV|nr:LEA domain protein [Aspergillus avenaceus]
MSVPTCSTIKPGLSLLEPLSRKGIGPGMMIVLVPDDAPNPIAIQQGIPAPSLKWSEEGYTIVDIRGPAIEEEDVIGQALTYLSSHDKCEPKDDFGLVGRVTAAVVYMTVSDAAGVIFCAVPAVQHLAGPEEVLLKRTDKLMQYHYPATRSPLFALPMSTEFNSGMEAISHTRNLTFLKKHMNGPYFHLEAIWEEHTYYEFANRSVENTMNTMVLEPYVNHTPTITGGIGREDLTRFYRDHFIFTNPKDTKNELVSRTIGIDRVIDEFIMSFTHDTEVDCLIPGVPPTGRKLEISMVAVVNIRGDRLYHEHITWDQGTVLVQLGLLPDTVAFPPGPIDGKVHGKREIQLPVAGAETAAKMRDKNSVPSNEMLKRCHSLANR